MKDLKAPVLLFTYNRPLHLKRTLENLAKNDLSESTLVFVFQDGLKENASQQEVINHELVREVVGSYKDCFLDLSFTKKDNHCGLATSVIDGLNWMFEKFQEVIVLEDDIVTSPGFLRFLNDNLIAYRNNKRVAGITGFRYPAEGDFTKPFFLPIGCSWGWATWKNSWKVFRENGQYLSDEIEKRGLIDEFNFGGYPFYQMLQDQNKGRVDSWAIRFYASFFLDERLFLYPPSSLVVNHGFDSSGTHTSREDTMFNTSRVDYIDNVIVPVSLIKKFVDQTAAGFSKRTTSDPSLALKIRNRMDKAIAHVKKYIRSTN